MSTIRAINIATNSNDLGSKLMAHVSHTTAVYHLRIKYNNLEIHKTESNTTILKFIKQLKKAEKNKHFHFFSTFFTMGKITLSYC